jgi:uncharacterized beta-barrel protein YwiB (DUF1934 family)
MDKSVIIFVRGNQTASNCAVNQLELITEGKYYKKEDAYYITYDESAVTGMDGTTTTFRIENGVVTMMRNGNVNTEFVFEKGQKHLSYYDSTEGCFTIGVSTNEVEVNVDDCGGEVRVDYQLEIDDNNSGSTDFYMHIREAGYTDEEYYRKYQNAVGSRIS